MSPFPTVNSSSEADFLEYFVLVYGGEKFSVDEIEFLKVLTQLDYSPFSKIQAIKDFGNSLFKQNQFDQAGDCYDTACRLLCSFLKDNIGLDFNSIFPLAVSLCLNLAACANKLQAFEQALIFCSMVLTFFPRNAKALFRKAVALKKLNRFSEACSNLEDARLIEPHNKDILHELENVQQSLAINKNGKRVVIHSLDANDVRAGKLFVTSSRSQKVVSSLHSNEATMAEQTPDDKSSVLCSDTERNGKDPLLQTTPSEGCAPVCSPPVPMDCASSSAASKDTNVCTSTSSTSSTNFKSPRVFFTNKHRPHNKLNLSSQAYDNLLNGQNLGFYHPRSMSFMRVRTLTSKTIQTGTPHDGTAEVPTTSPTSENFLHATDIEKTECSDLVKEETILQVDKKIRLNSDTPSASKISSVQFKFTAVKDHLFRKEDRTMDRCYSTCQKRRAVAKSRKRSLVSVDVVTCFCRYTRTTGTVMRTKRKDVHFIEFDAHYHPPFKKSRLFSSVKTTYSVCSVSWVSSSFGVANAPLFVL